VDSPLAFGGSLATVVGLAATVDAGASPVGAAPELGPVVDTMKGGIMPPDEASLFSVFVVGAAEGTIESVTPPVPTTGAPVELASLAVVGTSGGSESESPADRPIDGRREDSAAEEGFVSVVGETIVSGAPPVEPTLSFAVVGSAFVVGSFCVVGWSVVCGASPVGAATTVVLTVVGSTGDTGRPSVEPGT
jgi:hypothetical protein